MTKAFPASHQIPPSDERLRMSAIHAARLAAAIQRENFRSGIQAETKTSNHDLVTEIDLRSQRIITDFLLKAHPDSWVLGEEKIAEAPSRRPGATIQWIVDPLDGTSNFVHDIAFFCVSIAACVDGRLVASAIVDPISGDTFSANATQGFLNNTPLRPGPRPEQFRANLMTDYPTAESLAEDGPVGLELFGQWITDFATVRRKVSTALALAHVAAGWVDAAIGFDTKVWDVAAGAHLVQVTGGSYRGLYYGSNLGPAHLAPGFVAQGPGADYPTLTDAVTRITWLRNSKTGV